MGSLIFVWWVIYQKENSKFKPVVDLQKDGFHQACPRFTCSVVPPWSKQVIGSDISTLNGGSLKLEDKFRILSSSISSTESDSCMHLAKAWTIIDWLSIIWKSALSDKTKCNFFQAAILSLLPYGCTAGMLIKRIEKKLDRNSTRILPAIQKKSWKQYPTKQQLNWHLAPISKTSQIRWSRHTGHNSRSKDELISDFLLWNTSHRHASVDRLTRT